MIFRNSPFRLGSQISSPNDPQIGANSDPEGFKKAELDDKVMSDSSFDSDTVFVDFLVPNRPQMSSKIAETSDLGRPGAPRDAKDRPEASWEPCLSTLEHMLEPCCPNLGSFWGRF